ncbi:hypothetical protein [Alteromonas phage XX1924]|nr:hypothetical protein [Alteromonas phage XX1924]
MIVFEKKVNGSLVVGVNEHVCSGEISITNVGLLTNKLQLEFKGDVLDDGSLAVIIATQKDEFIKCIIKTPNFQFESGFVISSLSSCGVNIVNLLKMRINMHSAITKNEVKLLMASQSSKRQSEQLSHFAKQGVKVRLK